MRWNSLSTEDVAVFGQEWRRGGDCFRAALGFPMDSELVHRVPKEDLALSRSNSGPKYCDKQGPKVTGNQGGYRSLGIN